MPSSQLDIVANRDARKYSRGELLARVAWAFGRILFRLTPRPLFGVRRALLRLFGARIGRHVHVYPSAIIYFPWNLQVGDWSAIGEDVLVYNLGPVRIGARATISHRAHLCAGTHDYRRADLPLQKPAIEIGDQVWIAADAFVGPGVSIAAGAVGGARGVVVRDVRAWVVVAGNPARELAVRQLDPGGSG